MSDKIFSVKEINSYISYKINNDNNLFSVSIKGEISNLTKHPTGHYYLTLKDDNSVLKCIIFKNKTTDIDFDLKEGMSVIANGTIKGYLAGGSYSFYINTMELSSIGSIYLEFEARKKLYKSKGYFDVSIKKPIPKFPKNIGIITAQTGAAIKDIISTINRRYNIANIFLFPSIVQGNGAPRSIVKSLKQAHSYNTKLDVIILGRGGGSFEDLFCFSDPIVIEEIFKSQIPIISAVGHEIDYQISDFVADRRAETPTAAAEICTPNKEEIVTFLRNNFLIMKNNIIKKINAYEKNLNIYKENYHLKNLNWIYKEKSETLNTLKDKLIKNFNFIYQNKVKELITLKEKSHLLNPKNILSRGYSIVKYNDKAIIDSKSISVSDKLDIILHQGKLKTTITDIINLKEDDYGK